MKPSGVSRYFSRRDKHHEKRSTKPSTSKVRLQSLASFSSLTPLLCIGERALLQDETTVHRRRHSSSLEVLYHKLPSAFRSSVEDGLLFFQRNPSSRASLTSSSVQSSANHSSDHQNQQLRPSHQISPELYTIFTNEDAQVAADKDVEKKVKMLLTRLQGAGIMQMEEQQAQHALRYYPNDLDKAYNLLVLANESFEGELKDYKPNVPMLGAINRNQVTCYLDALLFAMFARLDSFEAMLYENFDDEPRKKLAAVLRLWVNMLRTGQLIGVELTKHLQDALAKCGWEDAAKLCQQDASEAFTFITGALELPLLTLKMDIYHTGREDKEDDHKFVNERLLEVAIPEQEDDHVICLEDCLETYFNNRIEVKRYLQRQNTIASTKSKDEVKDEAWIDKDPEKNEILHVETIEISGADTPVVETPTTFEPATPSTPLSPTRPHLDGRRRADSIFGKRYTQSPQNTDRFDEKKHLQEMLDNSSSGRPRSASLLRKEILMPAWQFFSLIPWYTDNAPKSDAQVAAHFSVKRPMLGICLKRYTMLPNGAPKRLDTFIDIPLEIGLPHFVSDEGIKDEGPLFGNFKLVLQSVVCHRGVSVDSGHYVALVRANSHERPGTSQSGEDQNSDTWLRFDDLANPRVMEVEIKKTLREESPYLLFYQVQPINEELASRGDPPTYDEAQVVLPSTDPSKETLASIVVTDANTSGEVDAVTAADVHPEVNPFEDPGSRNSISRTSFSSNRRSSVAFEDVDGSPHNGFRGRTQPPTPATPDDQRTSFLPASRRGSRIFGTAGSKSRTSSPNGDSRLSLTLSRLTGRGSKDKLVPIEGAITDDPVIVINEVDSADNGRQAPVADKEQKVAGLGRSKSTKGRKDRFRSKSREPSDTAARGKHKEKSRPDRECIVM